ncbi:hypothetical protein D910_11969, partial [Dendroctonus ponderosae]
CPQETDNQKYPADSSLKVPHKIIANWRSACDKTKDKTKDLLKRWRTLPEIETEGVDKSSSDAEVQKENRNESGWSVHVWTTWVDRFSIDSDEEHIKEQPYILTPMQISKYSHFFTNLLDHDQDNLICEQDFEALIEVLFQVINRGGTEVITRDELSNFYSSVLCLDTTKVGEILDIAYQAMTSNGDHPLHYRSFRLCFSNYLLGRYPNGSGHHILGAPPDEKSSTMFPIDYSALNAQPEDLEQYTPDQKSNRRSVIV